MENMPPRNSFPQICVVSVIHFVRIAENGQEYQRIVSLISTACLCQNSCSLMGQIIAGQIASTPGRRAPRMSIQSGPA